MRFFTSSAPAKYSSFVLLNIFLFFLFPILDINQIIRGKQKIRNYIFKFFISYTQLPLRVLNKNLNDLDRILLFQDVNGFVICCMLFLRIVCNPCQLHP